MRNASVEGQALAPIEFPYPENRKHDWSAMYADYAERMKAMSTFTFLMHKKMCLADAMITLSPQGKKPNKHEVNHGTL